MDKIFHFKEKDLLNLILKLLHLIKDLMILKKNSHLILYNLLNMIKKKLPLLSIISIH